MANEFVVRNGLIALDNSTISGSSSGVGVGSAILNVVHTGSVAPVNVATFRNSVQNAVRISLVSSDRSFQLATNGFADGGSVIGNWNVSSATPTLRLMNANETTTFLALSANTTTGVVTATTSASSAPIVLQNNGLITTGSLNVDGNITGSNILATGTITAQTLLVQTITSSVSFITGSTKFGTLLTNTHQFTGSVSATGSLSVDGLSTFRKAITVDYGTTNRTTQIRDDGLYMSRTSDGSYSTTITGATGYMTFVARNYFTFQSNGVETVKFNENGTAGVNSSFGIGTFSPVGYNGYDGAGTRLEIRDTANNLVSAHWRISAHSASIGLQNGSWDFRSSNPVQFTQRGVNTIYLGTNGNVGINTTTPSSASLHVDGNVWANSYTGSLQGTASWANNVLTASFALTASTTLTSATSSTSITSSYPIAALGTQDSIYTPFDIGNVYPSGSIILGVKALSSSLAVESVVAIGSFAGTQATAINGAVFIGATSGYSASVADYSTFIGPSAGYNAVGSFQSVFAGRFAGNQAQAAYNSVFIGYAAGDEGTSSEYSVFIGSEAGYVSGLSNNSVFIGNKAGYFSNSLKYCTIVGDNAAASATNSQFVVAVGHAAGQQTTKLTGSIFIGTSAGSNSVSASFSTLIGHGVGGSSIGPNNIIIGTNIGLPSGRRDSINLGGIVFATGSYSTTTGTVFSGSVGNGRVGINMANPTYSLDVSGSGNYTGGLTVTGSLIAPTITGSLQGTSSFAVTASYALNSAGGAAPTAVTYNRVTASYTLVLTDAGKTVEMSGSTPAVYNITVPPSSSVNFADGTYVDIILYGTGSIQFVTGSGVTFRSANNWTKLGTRYGAATLLNIAGDEWYIIGNLNA